MKRILALTTAALMSTGIAGSALAQGVDVDLGAGAGAEIGGGAETGVEAGAGADMDADVGTDDLDVTGAAGADANLGAVVSAINTGQFGTAEIETATEISSVNVVRIDELPGGEEQQAIDQALDRHQAEVDDLRAAIEANAEIAGELEAQGVASDQVVAAQTDANGAVTVFVR
jgi:hypothetical protein